MRDEIHSEIRGDNCFSVTSKPPEITAIDRRPDAWLEPVMEGQLCRTSDYDLLKEMEKRGFLRRIHYQREVYTQEMDRYSQDAGFVEHLQAFGARAIADELNHGGLFVHRVGNTSRRDHTIVHSSHLDILDIRRLLS